MYTSLLISQTYQSRYRQHWDLQPFPVKKGKESELFHAFLSSQRYSTSHPLGRGKRMERSQERHVNWCSCTWRKVSVWGISVGPNTVTYDHKVRAERVYNNFLKKRQTRVLIKVVCMKGECFEVFITGWESLEAYLVYYFWCLLLLTFLVTPCTKPFEEALADDTQQQQQELCAHLPASFLQNTPIYWPHSE